LKVRDFFLPCFPHVLKHPSWCSMSFMEMILDAHELQNEAFLASWGCPCVS
jgi:hypothetical protein